MLEISIIIPTYNSIKFIKPCLESISSQDYKDFEVIVIDNGSKDGTIDFMRENYPQIRLIENKENLGSCKARNQGITISKGRWILTLDCDVILERDFLKKIMCFVKGSEESMGVFQPKILNTDRRTLYSCGVYLSWLRRFYDIGKGQIDNGQFNTSEYIFGACSACALYKREMLEDIKEQTGYFDERFFFLVEDVDLAWRAQRKGWQAVFLPEARCYHYGNSSHSERKIKQHLCFRNRYYSIKKNEGLINYSKRIFPLLFYDLPRLCYMVFTNRCLFRKLFSMRMT